MQVINTQAEVGLCDHGLLARVFWSTYKLQKLQYFYNDNIKISTNYMSKINVLKLLFKLCAYNEILKRSLSII